MKKVLCAILGGVIGYVLNILLNAAIGVVLAVAFGDYAYDIILSVWYVIASVCFTLSLVIAGATLGYKKAE